MDQKHKLRRRITRSILEAFIGAFWGTFLYLSCRELILGLSGHPLSPVAVIFSLLAVLIFQHRLPNRIQSLKIPGLIHVTATVLLFLVSSRFGILYRLVPGTSGNLAPLLLAVDAAVTVLFFTIPVWFSKPIQRYIDSPSAILTGSGLGILLCGVFISRSFSSTACLLITAIPAFLILLLIKTPKQPEEKIPEREFPHFLTGWAFFLSAGTLFLTGFIIRIFSGLTFASIPGILSVVILSAALGSIFGRRAVPLFQAPLSSAASILAGTGSVAGLALCSLLHTKGLFVSSGTSGNPVNVLILTAVCTGIPACAAGILFRALTERGFRFSGIIKRETWGIAVFLLPFIIAQISMIWAVIICGIFTAVLGMAASVLSHDRTDTRVSAGLITGAFILIILSLFSPSLSKPLCFSSNVLSVFAGSAEDTETFLSSRYRLTGHGEYGTGSWCTLKDRKTELHYTVMDAELLFPDEFLNDDMSFCAVLPAIFKPRESRLLYGGPSDAGLISMIETCFSGPFTLTELYPGSMQKRSERLKEAKVVHRNIRGYLQTTGNSYDVIISVSPPPSSPLMHGLHTVSFFKAAADRLTPNGILVHYLPCYKLIPETFNAVLSAFSECFPDSTTVWVYDNYIVLLGGIAPGSVDYTDSSLRFSEFRKAAGFRSIEEILACYSISGSRLDRVLSSFPPLEDSSLPLFHAASEAGEGKYIFQNYQFVTELRASFSKLLKDENSSPVSETYLKGRNHYSKAREMWMLGDIREAEKEIEKSIEANPGDSVPAEFSRYMKLRKTLGLARAHHEKNQLEEALKLYEEAEKAGELSSAAYRDVAQLYLDLSAQAQWPADINYARKALYYSAASLSISPSSESRDYAVRALLKLNLAERAAKVTALIQDDDPGYPDLHRLQTELEEHRKINSRKEPDPDLEKIMLQAFNTLLHSENRPEIEQSITRLLAAGGTIYSILEQGFSAGTAEEKKRILHLYSRIGGDPALSFVRKVFPGEKPEIQRECLGILGMYGNGSDAKTIAAFLNTKYSSRTRSHAVITLAGMKHRKCIPFLIEALGDTEEAIRSEARNALAGVHPMFSNLSIDKLSSDDIILLKKKYTSLEADLIGWPPFPGE